MTMDLQTILLIGGAAILVILLLWLLLRPRRQRVIERPEAPTGDPYVASKERPYVKQPAVPGQQPQPPPAFVARDIRVDGVPVTPAERAPMPEVFPPAAPVGQSEVPPTAPVLPNEDPEVAAPPLPIAGEFAGIAMPPGATDHADVLTRLKGVGPKLAALLNEHGITRYEQLASLNEAELGALDAGLGSFAGRLTRDRVSEQARFLASGDTAGFEAAFGKLGG